MTTRGWLPGRSAPTHHPVPSPPPPLALDATRVDSDAGLLWFPASDGVIAPFIRRTGRWEPDEGDLLLKLARPGCRFLDVGANVGYFSALIARSVAQAQITAVEPEPTSLALLRLNLWAHAPSARIFGVALSSGDRVLALNRPESNPGDTRAHSSADRATLLAPAAPGDEILAGSRFDLVKIDVQGGELDVIIGLLETLRRSPGVQLVVEFFPSAIRSTNRTPENVLARYRELGFDILAQVRRELLRCSDDQVVDICTNSGPEGYLNLLMRMET